MVLLGQVCVGRACFWLRSFRFAKMVQLRLVGCSAEGEGSSAPLAAGGRKHTFVSRRRFPGSGFGNEGSKVRWADFL
jgi:hypothetical protein